MSAGVRLPLADARDLADEVVELLKSACERIVIAGSIRRQKADVGDIEIIAIPKTEPFLKQDLFGTFDGAPWDLLHAHVVGLTDRGVFRLRLNKNGQKSFGGALKWLTFCGFALDIYTATSETWGVTLAIRTGDADFSRLLVTQRSQGGFCPGHLMFKGWRVCQRMGGEPLDTPDEADVFRALGMEYLEPSMRSGTVRVAR